MTLMGRCSLVLAVAINAALSACQCEVQSTEPEAPPRPSGVQAKAIWAGGVDGGDFILLTPAKPDGTYAAKIYNDIRATSSLVGSFACRGRVQRRSMSMIQRPTRVGMVRGSS